MFHSGKLRNMMMMMMIMMVIIMNARMVMVNFQMVLRTCFTPNSGPSTTWTVANSLV